MKDVIYKWGPLRLDKTTEYRGTPCHVGVQDGDAFMWSICNEDSSYRAPKTAKLYPTGVSYTGRYIGTAVMPSGLVWHAIDIS
jgi:hypothetical protein